MRLTLAALPDVVVAFLEGRKATTLDAYRRSLEDFARFTDAASIDDAARLLLSHGHGEANRLALAYRADLLHREPAPATVNARLAALRCLVKLAGTLGLVPWRLEVPSVKAKAYRDTRGPGREGVKVWMSVC